MRSPETRSVCQVSIVDLDGLNRAEDDVLIVLKVEFTHAKFFLRSEALDHKLKVFRHASLLTVLMPDCVDRDILQVCQSPFKVFGIVSWCLRPAD